MYFIESVTTYSTTGKTKRGEILQRVAERFEHMVLINETALSAFANQLRILVDVCNTSLPGKPAEFRWWKDSGAMAVGTGAESCDTYIFMIHYAPIMGNLGAYQIRNEISDVLFKADRDLAVKFISSSKKGGEK